MIDRKVERVDSTSRAEPGVREQWATRAVFMIAGLGMAAWAPLVPYAKQRLDLDPAVLGLLLLCLGAGSILAMPLAGSLTARRGCRSVIRGAALALCVVIPLLAAAPTLPLMALALLVFGAAIGALDVAVNVQAVLVEQAARRAMMSGFHGLFSVGGAIGAGGLSALLWAGASPLIAATTLAVAILALLLSADRHLLPYGGQGRSRFFALPRGPVLLVGCLCFAAFLAEGAMLDWSAVFLSAERGMAPAQAGLGYAVFSAAMTAGRLGGDRLVQRFGQRAVLTAGALVAAVGLAVAVLVPFGGTSFAGFTMVGLGAANIVPVLYSTLGRQQAMPPALAIAAVTALGYSGILTGPALIGFIADAAGLAAGLIAVAALLLLVAAGARRATA